MSPLQESCWKYSQLMSWLAEVKRCQRFVTAVLPDRVRRRFETDPGFLKGMAE